MWESALSLVKDRLGLRSTIRDVYLVAIVNGVISELSDVQGLVLVETNPHHLMFVVDLAAWRYENRDNHEGMPRHLQFRFHNLIIGIGNNVT